jgi:hypothetical protein
LKQLPGADPMLRGSGGTPTPSGARPVGAGSGVSGRAAASPSGPTTSEKLGVWARVVLGLVVGVLMTQWPYNHGCGVALYLYMAAIVAVTVAGVWGGVSSWKFRLGLAHVLSLLVVVWGLALGAAQILPRVGYAARPATWQCTL